MSRCSAILVFALLSGCTSVALRNGTLSQGESAVDVRYQEVVENLALLYANPTALPAYSSIFAGTVDINDTLQINPATTWQRSQPVANGPFVTVFNNQVLDVPATRTVKQNWTLDPVIAPEKLTAIACACRSVLFGPENAGPDCDTLGKYVPSKSGDRALCYFDVSEQLALIQLNCPCWLHLSDCLQRPRCARFWASCHGKCVWVEPDGMAGLSQFTLVIQKIARADLNALMQPGVSTRQITLSNAPLLRQLSLSDFAQKKYSDQLEEYSRSGKPPAPIPVDGRTLKTVTFYVDDHGTPTPGDKTPVLPRKSRFDNMGQNADVKSAISAVSKSP
jgi:hypothetical protein